MYFSAKLALQEVAMSPGKCWAADSWIYHCVPHVVKQVTHGPGIMATWRWGQIDPRDTFAEIGALVLAAVREKGFK